ncbi:aromatic ring-hydroxylating dioxygenase subunit alpha [Halieaceae bacterium IMCC14734]|uniref:Aromatic ring-hydroxylating dioxygenase subunit alpha n=1 Tax=Candidatus Litorirhabdus singularis TaxID=2518993 RepID=A0ABT3TJS7_9GAMM|nr:aromatic ring-hydroxylating dioxygenase subunit alpha [Candidatus Litorirhabdus singularis]MCX2982536.1 aromatic ring-hydroxylating dioxygenase subunit alpha [Candidatus Litorirhabdus singularis]
MVEFVTGSNRSAGASYADILDADSHPVRDILRAESPLEPGPTRIPADYYYSREIHEREIEKIWKRSWQLACHEDELRDIGDYYVYDIATLSFLVVKTAEDTYQAFYNQCLHRGRQLCDQSGKSAYVFRCPFHGWAWNLDGSLQEIPCEWDFPSVDKAEYGLPEVQVARWGGFLFINPDPEAESFASHIGNLSDHFTLLPFEKRYKAVHVAKVLKVNWKVAQEAFMEAYHVIATHPTILDSLGDSNSKYDVFGNYSRAISPQQVESPHIRPYEPAPDSRMFTRLKHAITGFLYERIEDNLVAVTDHKGRVSHFHADGSWVNGPMTHCDPNMCNWIGGKQLPGAESVPYPAMPEPAPSENRRSVAAKPIREDLRATLGDSVDEISDAELLDAIYFTVFPNWHPWGSFNDIFYRFSPNGDNPDECVHECWYMRPSPNGEERPDPAPVHWLDADADYTEAPELGLLAKVFNQDVHNMPQVQKGLKAMKRQEVIFADYEESKIRHWYQLYLRAMELD